MYSISSLFLQNLGCKVSLLDRKRIIIVVPTSSFVAHDSGRDGKFLRENCSFYETGHFFPMFILMGFTGDFECKSSYFSFFQPLSVYTARQCETDVNCHWGFSASQSYVQFSECVVIFGCVLFLSCHSKAGDQFPVRE